jgi:hypothetical protein
VISIGQLPNVYMHLKWIWIKNNCLILTTISHEDEHWMVAQCSYALQTNMKIRWPYDTHCHFTNRWVPNDCPNFIRTLSLNENKVTLDIHFPLRCMWTSICHSIVTFTLVEGWNWVATWYWTLLEMQVGIKWLPNPYPCLKHKWGSNGRPMLTLNWNESEYWMAIQYSHSVDVTSNIEELPSYVWSVGQDPMAIQYYDLFEMWVGIFHMTFEINNNCY